MEGPTAVANISSQTTAENGPPSSPSTQHKQDRVLAGGLRQIMPGTTVVWGRRFPGQQTQLGPGQQGRLVPGVPLQAVVAASSSFSASITSKPRVVSMCASTAGPYRSIPAVRQPQQRMPGQPVALLQQLRIQQIQQLDEQQDSTGGPALVFKQQDDMESSDIESDASDSGDISSDSEGDADEVQYYEPMQYRAAAAAEEQDTADSEGASLDIDGKHVKRRRVEQ